MTAVFRFLPVLAASWLASHPVHATLVHRWSFNNPAGNAPAGSVFSDSLDAAPAVVVGTGATLNGTALTLPGSTAPSTVAANTIAAYVDLPNGLISSKTNLTVEIWASIIAERSNQRLLDFGRMAHAGVGNGAAPGEVTNDSNTAPAGSMRDDLNWNVSRSANINQQRLESRINAAGAVAGDTSLVTTAGAEYHWVMTYTAGAGTFPAGGQARWYRNGTLAATINLAHRLSSISDVNNWLGRSQNTADLLANIRYNELRIWDQAFSQNDISTSYAAGPNHAFTLPTASADSQTMHRNQKSVIPVLSNDANSAGGIVTDVTPPAFGTALPDAAGRVRYTHTTGTPATDSFTYRVATLAGQSAPATVSINFAIGLRIANPLLGLPVSPPATEFQLVPAFPGIAATAPTTLATAPGDTKRLFICQKAGVLRLIPDVTAAPPTSSVFLDVATLLTGRGHAISTSSENGLIGLAFHPAYATNGYFYLFYSVTISGTNYQRVSRFTRSAGNPNTADTASELILIEQKDDYTNHNGGCLQFGPDGYLYISLGDEGDQNDAGNNSQRINKDFFSCILRIDVDRKPGSLEPAPNPNPSDYPTEATRPPDAVKRDSGIARYSIPLDNPFVPTAAGGSWNGLFNGTAVATTHVRTEFWAVGLRNPWRMAFDIDPADNNRVNLWVGDVGGGAREEVDLVTRGGNYGWALREGLINGPKSGQAPTDFDTLYGIRPLYEYRRTGTTGVSDTLTGNSITGGVVYRGARFPSLTGVHVFADYVSGNVWTLRRNGTATPTVTRIASEGSISGFGVDPSNGDILVADYNDNRILRLVTGLPAGNPFPATLSATNLFADLTDLSPSPGLLPYQVNLPFWSDHALKRRWFAIPDGTGRMTWSRDGNWTFPAGQVWVKHFEMELTRGNPATRKRLETRLLVKNPGGSYGVSYRWNDAGTEAALVPDEGAEFPLTISVNGTPTVQNWQIPSRGQCLICHTPQAGHALSSNTRQFTMESIITGFGGPQVGLLTQHGFFANTPDPDNTLPRHLRPEETAWPVESRARSYLDVNCSYCHRPAGGTPATWDVRSSLTLAATGIINGSAANNGGDPLNKLIIPGDAAHSIILNRMAAANGFSRMPALATSQLDEAGIALLTEWINTRLPARQGYAPWRAAQFPAPDSPEGEPGFDADGDGASNQTEFLAGTLPRDSSSLPAPATALTAPANFRLTFPVPADRSAEVETSVDLTTWLLWNVPGNDGLTRAPGPRTWEGPVTEPRQYFRLKLREN